MTFVSRLTLAAVLALGTTAMATMPAAAQKKNEKQSAGPDLKVSADFRKAAVPAQTAIVAKDWATASPLVDALDTVAKNDDEKYFAAYLRLELERGRGSTAGELRALDVLVSSPKTPAEAARPYGARREVLLGVAAAQEKKHPETIQHMLKARELGSQHPDISVTLANAYAATNRPAEAVAETDRAIKASKAEGRKPPEPWYRFAIPRVVSLGDRGAMADWLTRYIQEYPTVQNWRWATVVFRNAGETNPNKRSEQIDMFRLMRATNSLATRSDYADYAYAAQQSGLPWEAVSAIDEGRKLGKVPAGDPDTGRTYTSAQAGVKVEGSLDALAKQASAKDGKFAAQTGDAFLASANYARALELYDIALGKPTGVNVDEVTLHRGIALHRLGRKEDARAAFKAVKPGPYASLALLWQASIDFPPLS